MTRCFRSEFEQLFPDERLPGNAPGQLYDREAVAMVQQDKARGYVIGESFYRHGISSIVYPVFNRSGRVAAVVSILVPSDEIRKAIANGCRTTSVWRRTKFPASSDICHRQVKSTT